MNCGAINISIKNVSSESETYPLDSKGLGRELETASIFAIKRLLSSLARDASSLYAGMNCLQCPQYGE